MDAWAGIEQATPDEQWLVNTLREGKLADFGTRRGSIRAEVLRNLLLALADDSPAGPRIPLTGVRIRNACLNGPLDLADLARPGVGFPALMLEYCDLPGEINLEASRFARLSIKGSRFRHLNMRESEIDGPFDFSGTAPYVDDDGTSSEAWIDARGCIVNGEITGSGARLVRTPRPTADVKKGERRYALSLANADVRGSVMLLNGFSAQGGMCLRSARITGDIWATGATVTRGEGYALNAQAARIGDVLHLNRGFTARGKVWLLATQIGARLLLDGATLYGTDENGSEAPHRDRVALEASNLQVAADVYMGEKFAAYGEVNFSGAGIRGIFRCGRATLSNRTSDGRARALVATNAELGDEVQFDGANVEGRINLNGAKVGGRLSFNGATINNRTADGSGVALSAIGARIGGNLRFAALGADVLAKAGCENVFRSCGNTNFSGAEVGGDLLFRGCSLRNHTDDGKGIALSAQRIRVGGNMEFTGNFRTEGATMLSGAIVGRGVLFRDSEFRNPPRGAIYAEDMQIGDDLRFVNTTAKGDLRLERIDVAGRLIWRGLQISCIGKHRSPLDLRHGRVGSVLEARELSFDSPSSIDLCGLRVGAIENTWPHGWGSRQPGLTINFDGLVYERITLPLPDPSARSSPPASHGHLLARIFGRGEIHSPINTLAGSGCRGSKLRMRRTTSSPSLTASLPGFCETRARRAPRGILLSRNSGRHRNQGGCPKQHDGFSVQDSALVCDRATQFGRCSPSSCWARLGCTWRRSVAC
jgi:hypothetical protein